jgi:prespore-specific regulator
MRVTRQDAWTVEEDSLLTDIVLDSIRSGKTQLSAFQDAAEKLSRTASACGFRWNARIRKEKREEMQQARLVKTKESTPSTPFRAQTFSSALHQANDINVLLSGISSAVVSIKKTFEENELLKKERADEKRKAEELQKQNQLLLDEISMLEQDYKSMLQIFEKARNLSNRQEKPIDEIEDEKSEDQH